MSLHDDLKRVRNDAVKQQVPFESHCLILTTVDINKILQLIDAAMSLPDESKSYPLTLALKEITR